MADKYECYIEELTIGSKKMRELGKGECFKRPFFAASFQLVIVQQRKTDGKNFDIKLLRNGKKMKSFSFKKVKDFIEKYDHLRAYLTPQKINEICGKPIPINQLF